MASGGSGVNFSSRAAGAAGVLFLGCRLAKRGDMGEGGDGLVSVTPMEVIDTTPLSQKMGGNELLQGTL